jgi:hypothetical protein
MKTSRFAQMKDQRKKIALERIEILEGMKKKRPDFSARYDRLIKRLTEKYRLQ